MHALRSLPFFRCAALAALVFVAAQTVFAQQQQRQPSPQLVESVEVTGNRRLNGQDILKQLQTRPGDPYDEQQVQRDLQALANLGVFDRSRLRVTTATGERGGVEVSFAVRELPLIESVKFEGLLGGDELVVRRGLRRKGLEMRAGGVLDMDKLNAAVTEVERLLHGRGWHNVGVELRTEDVSANSVRLTFVVARGLPPKQRLDRKKSDRIGRQDPTT